VALLRARQSAIAQGLPAFGATQKHTISTLLDRVVATYQRKGGKSLKTYQAHLRPIRRTFGGKRVVDLTSQDVERYISQRQEQGRSNPTINKELGMLKAALTLAHREGILPRQCYVPHLPGDTIRQGFWEAHELARLLAVAPPWLCDVAEFGYLTGWRRGEILGLAWGQVDMPAQTILLPAEHTKAGSGRLLALEGPLLAVLERRWHARRPCPWVFHIDGQPIGRQIERAWTRACKASGNEGKLFHDFRRTAARNMRKAGVSERIAMEITGHKTRSVFDRYNIVDDADMRQALQQTYAYLQAKPPVVIPINRMPTLGQ
jgi:integrase